MDSKKSFKEVDKKRNLVPKIKVKGTEDCELIGNFFIFIFCALKG